MTPPTHIAEYVSRTAAERPDAVAIFEPIKKRGGGLPDYRQYTYRELDDASLEIARGLLEIGIGPSTRVAVMVKPSFELFALTFGLFRLGAVPVLIDPGIGPRRMGACLAGAQVEAFIGIPLAHWARILLGWGRATIRRTVTIGRFRLWGGHSLAGVRALGAASKKVLPEMSPDDDAAILFTSGSTGAPKGVVYQARHFLAQVELIRETYDIQPGEIDLPTFPLFALFDPALGMTTVIPQMDPTRPAAADPRVLVETIQAFEVTNMFGSPALLNTLGRYLVETESRLPTLKRVISAGAAVPAATIEKIESALDDDALIHTPYGATECLPVATADNRTILNATRDSTARGAGVCVGDIVRPNSVHVIRITDEPITDWSETEILPVGEIGEIVVRGPTTTQCYYGLEQATRMAKIVHGDEPWRTHRMGDVGYIGHDGRLWFCGRKAHRVVVGNTTYFTVPIEAVFNTHPAVFRSALIGVTTADHVVPVLCVELEPIKGPAWPRIVDELRDLAASQDVTRDVGVFLRHDGFPVDIRHNAKIRREELALWARGKLP